MELVESLVNLGLNEKEAKVYLALLSLDKSTAYTVAVRSGLKKPTTYVILENLVNKGFALKIPSEEKHYYLAKSPKECLLLAREKLSNFEDALPELMAIKKGEEEKVNISYYEGMEGIKETYKRLFKEIKNSEVVGFYSHGKDSPKDLVRYWDEWTKKRKEKNIRVRGITTQDFYNKDYVKNQESNLIKLKPFSSEEYNSNVSVEVYDKFTQIISSRYLQSILIENSDIANVLKQIFELIWKKY